MGTNASKSIAKKVIAIFLAALMIVTALPMTAFAAPTEYRPIDIKTIGTWPASTVWQIDGIELMTPERGDEYPATWVMEDEFIDANIINGIGLRFAVYLTVKGDKNNSKFVVSPLSIEELDGLFNIEVAGTYAGYKSGDGVKATLDMNNESIVLINAAGQTFDTTYVINVFPNFSLIGRRVAWEDLNENEDDEFVIVLDDKKAIKREEKQQNGFFTVDTEAVNVEGDRLNATTIETTWKIDVRRRVSRFEFQGEDEIVRARRVNIYDGLNQGVTLGAADPAFFNIEGVNTKIVEVDADDTKDINWFYSEEGKLFLARRDAEDDGTGLNDGQDHTYDVAYYMAYDNNGGLYLTRDKSKAADVSFFRLSVNRIVEISVTTDPACMTYGVGEQFNPNGAIITVVYENGAKRNVPSDLFNIFGITVQYPNLPLTVGEDGEHVRFTMAGHFAKTKGTLTVINAEDVRYVLADVQKDGTIADGEYIIVFGRERRGEVRRANALMSDTTVIERGVFEAFQFNVASTYSASTLGATNVRVDIDNERLYIVDEVPSVWNIKGVRGGYTVQDVDGNYLSLGDFDDSAEFTIGWKGIDAIAPLKVSATRTDASLWKISGTKAADMQIGTKDATGAYKFGIFNRNYGIFNGLAIAAKFEENDNYDDCVYLFKKVVNPIVKLKVLQDPTLNYNQGDALDLQKLILRATYENGREVEIRHDEFTYYGVNFSIPEGTILNRSNDGQKIVATVDGVSAETKALSINPTKVDTKVLSGSTRIETALAISKDGWATSEYVVIANAMNYPDALAGVSLAAAYNAPILLTNGRDIEANVAAEIIRLGATKTLVLGGENSISASIFNAVPGAIRIAGATRYETAVKIAETLAAVKGASSDIFFVSGLNFADALSVATVAAVKGAPVLYVPATGDLNSDVAAYINKVKASVTATTVVGGESSVSEGILKQIAAIVGKTERISGATRYDTSLAVAEAYKSLFTSKKLAVATGKTFPDALTGGAYAAKYGMPLVLLDDSNAPAVANFVKANGITDVVAFGGSVSPSALAIIA